ncbi:hypothetical protein ASG01_15110 [Chryseobacterium sp. Leaf180]|uniref:SpvB/TcaC N-terminal domain-containing protein n=1 Tax=Chryseobacterium sp. Leaf180 TaxID=1736289 RepID=UPI0006F80956|nr:SpvB/TcaC N-terminal domain-containing protein [Chryseobacterium sp. Leaf180]KQR90441.1 hypothetical protein ASG01_15110 [Chryseobacterium sp. Leaf180]
MKKNNLLSRKKGFILPFLFFTFIFISASLSKDQIRQVRIFKLRHFSEKDAVQADTKESRLKPHLFEDLNSKSFLKNSLTDSTLKNGISSSVSTAFTDSLQSFTSLPNEVLLNGRDKKYAAKSSFDALEKQGQIGVQSEGEEDKISDNFFSIDIPKQKQTITSAYLEYDLYGLAGHQSVSRSINQNPSIGGQHITVSYKWTHQRESINLSLLQEGKNKILFTAPAKGIIYKIKNVKIVFDHVNQCDDLDNITSSINGNSLYLKGFVKNQGNGLSHILIDGQKVNTFSGEFEKTISLNSETLNKGFVPISFSGSIINYPISGRPVEAKAVKDEQLNLQVFEILKEKEHSYNYEGAQIEVTKQNVGEANFSIGALKLRGKDFPTTNQGIRNVTLDGRAYRFKIASGKISKKILISIPYDSKLLGNFSAKEIKVFYFDYQSKKWMVETSSKVDETTKTIKFESYGDGDYINGVISVPESPQVNSFAPTSISGLKAGDPTSGMHFMSPPSVSQKGDANVSYPIVVPSGRNGVQPSLSVSYSSGAGNGWMGEGWDISGLSAITIDTRWGTPKFDPTYETELYSFDGEMLVYDGNYLPHRHNDIDPNSSIFTTAKQERSALMTNNKKTFFLRRNHDFTKIERFGTSTSDYRWIVTSTNGSKSYYGGSESGVEENSVIRQNDNINGKIVQWALWKVEDVHKNNIKYIYENVSISASGVNSNLNGGKYFHIKQIVYTGFNGSDGTYTVDFEKETSITRNDISINGKQGLKRVEPYKLNSIYVKYNSQIIRKYNFSYIQGEFFKTLLKNITELDKDNAVSNYYDLEYFNDLKDPQSGQTINFSPDKDVSVPQQLNAFPILPNSLQPSRINSAFSTDWGVSGRLTAGVNFLKPSQDGYGHIQFSGMYGVGGGTSINAQQLIDFDGDGVQDLIYRVPGSSGGLRISSGVLDANGALTFSAVRNILNLNSEYSHTKTKTDIKGYDFGARVRVKWKIFGFGININLGFNRAFAWSTSKSETSTFLTDANFDGLMDVVQDGKVWFNKRSAANGAEMTPFSDNTENMVIIADALAEHTEPPVDTGNGPPPSVNDVVKFWIAPKDGNIKFSDIVSIENVANAEAIYSVEIKNPNSQGNKNGRIFLKKLTNGMASVNVNLLNYNSYTSYSPQEPNNLLMINSSAALYVSAGDKVFVRLHKNNNNNFKVISNPSISYVNVSDPNDVNLQQDGFFLNNGSYSENFLLNNTRKALQFNSPGTVNISIPSFTFPKSSDKITFKIIKDDEVNLSQTEIYSREYDQNDIPFPTDPVNLNLNISSSDTINIRFVVDADSYLSFKNHNWNNIDVTYNASATANNAAATYNLKGIAEYPSYYLTEFLPKIDNVALGGNLPNTLQDYKIQINKSFSSYSGLTTGDFYYVIKKGLNVLGKRKVSVSTGANPSITETDMVTGLTVNGISPIFFYNGNLQQPIPSSERITVQVYVSNQDNIICYRNYRSKFPLNKAFNIYGGSSNAVVTTVNATGLNSAGLNPKVSLISNNWGQFLYDGNNDVEMIKGSDGSQVILNTSTPSDIYGRLINTMYIADFSMPPAVLSGNSSCDNLPTPAEIAACYFNANSGSNSPYYNGTVQSLTPVIPLDTNKKDNVEKWRGLGPEQYTMRESFKDDEDTTDIFNLSTQNPSATNTTVQGNVNTTMLAISKKHYSRSKTTTNSGSFASIGGSNSAGLANSKSILEGIGSVDLQDYLDMNGDGYPDIVYKDAMQLSNSTGGLGGLNPGTPAALQAPFVNAYLSNTDSYSNGLSASYDYTKFKTVGVPIFVGTSIFWATVDTSPTWSTGMSLSANFDSKDSGESFWIDVNGDGLPDRISGGGTPNMNVSLNLGNQLLPPSTFNNFETYVSRPIGSAGLAFSPGGFAGAVNNSGAVTSGFSFGGSISASASLGTGKATYEDINGDGLIDVLNIFSNYDVLNISSNYTEVRYNLGNKFSDPVRLYKSAAGNIDFNNETKRYSGALSLHGQFYLNLPVFFIFYVKVGVAADASFGAAITEVDKAFKDMDGDGFPDLVVSNSNGFKVNYSSVGRTNKLKKVTLSRQLKREQMQMGIFEMDYEFSKPTYNDPHAKLVMKEVRIINPDVNSPNYLISDPAKDMVTQFKYENSRYDRRERDNFGFEFVTVNEMEGNSVYRSNRQTYYNNGYLMNGMLKSSQSFSSSGSLLSSSENSYVLRKFKNGFYGSNSEIDLSIALPLDFDTGGKEGRKMARVFLGSTTSVVYENGGQMQTTKSYEYHPNGQISKYLHSSPASNYNAIIGYHSLNVATNIQGIPKSINVYEGSSSSNVLRSRGTQINTIGQITQVGVKLNNSEYSFTNFTYDQYGNMESVVYPNNYTVTYQYDSVLHKYVTLTQDSFDVRSSATYDPLFDAITEAIDTSDNIMRYSYDAKGRLKSILAPKEAGVSPYTVEYEYDLYPFPHNNNGNLRLLFGAKTRNFDPQNPTNPIETISIADGLGRVVQVKKDIELDGEEKMSVSGVAINDVHGRTIVQYHPTFEAKDVLNSSPQINTIYNYTPSGVYTTAAYDNRDRVIVMTDEDGHNTTTDFSIYQGYFKTSLQQQQNSSGTILKSESLVDADGKTKRTTNFLGSNSLTTGFGYNAIGELVEVNDPEGIATLYEYDLAGRRTMVNHPDHGISTYKYNTAGQLLELTTANLQNDPSIQTHYIQYRYDQNRLVGITLPKLPDGSPNPNDVAYTYGNSGAGNQTAKVTRKHDGSGDTTYSYGNMGEVVGQNKAVQGYSIPSMNFHTSYEYDSWNRIRNITYNDGEQVDYTYDLGGNLQSMSGLDTYIEKISYDHYGQRINIVYGNGTSSTYTYNPTNRLLNNHLLKESGGNDILNNQYSFDFVGNISGITNSSSQSNNKMGGNYNFGYRYDQLNRLIGAGGEFGVERKPSTIYQTSPYAVSNSYFNVDLVYNSSGGIVNKAQKHVQDQQGNAENSYNNSYKYIGGTHKVSEILDLATGNFNGFEYDYNGNVVGSMRDGNTDNMYWDEQDRLKAISNYDSGLYQYYVYDDGGERIIKYMLNNQASLYQNGALIDPGTLQMYDYTVYPNPYEVVSGNGTISKHYFAGSQRVASRINVVDPNLKQSAGTAKEKAESNGAEDDFNIYLKKAELEGKRIETEFEKAPGGSAGLYYLHGDHLGTATYVTDGNGETTQFFLNLPFGETMAEQNLPGAYDNPYKFNAKELDRETGLYYYGARYYNPRLSIWYGVDPLAEKMPSWSPYNYTFDNPIRYTDPDGRSPIGPGDPPMWAAKIIANTVPNLYSVFYYSNNSSNLNLYNWANDRNKEPEYKIRGLVGEAIASSVIGEGSFGDYYNGNQIDLKISKIAYDVNFRPTKTRVQRTVHLSVSSFLGNTSVVDYEDKTFKSFTNYTFNYEIKTFGPWAKTENLYSAYVQAITQTINLSDGDNTVGVLFTDRQAWMKVATDSKYGPLLQKQYKRLIDNGGQLQLQQDLANQANKATKFLKKNLKDK